MVEFNPLQYFFYNITSKIFSCQRQIPARRFALAGGHLWRSFFGKKLNSKLSILRSPDKSGRRMNYEG